MFWRAAVNTGRMPVKYPGSFELMLNKELLKYRINNNRVAIAFVEPDAAVLQSAGVLLSIYREALTAQTSRGSLEESLEVLLKNSPLGKVVGGMNKLICDHCEFVSASGGSDCAQMRENIFTAAAGILRDPPADPAVYRQMVKARCRNIDLPPDIYCDLSEFDRLSYVPQWSEHELVNIYNIALVQGVLFYADKLQLTVTDSSPMALRKLMRRLKFYRLLAEVKRVSASEISLILSGPAAIFGENRKYGLQLAAFFPVILLLENWKIRAELSLRGKNALVLNLDSRRCTLKSPLQHWAAYVPEEVALFIKAFRSGTDQWREAADADLPVIKNTGRIFPDFSFVRVDDPAKIVHVELFHRCYNDVLEDRLSFLEETPGFPLVVGIDRSALGKNGEKILQEKFPALEDHAFFFSNYPGAERVRKMLDKVCAATEKLL